MYRIIDGAIVNRFAPDNHVVPVLRWEQYDRVEGPGYFWINPVVERTLPPIKIGIRVLNVAVKDALTQDGIPFDFETTVLYSFDPRKLSKATAADFVRQDPLSLALIVQDYTIRALGRLVASVGSKELCSGEAVAAIERKLAHDLSAALRPLGLAPLREGGVLIKGIEAPENFTCLMLNAKLHELTLRAFQACPGSELAEQALRAELISVLHGHSSNLTILSPLDSLLLSPTGSGKVPGRNGS